jgi:hypothetical protein
MNKSHLQVERMKAESIAARAEYIRASDQINDAVKIGDDENLPDLLTKANRLLDRCIMPFASKFATLLLVLLFATNATAQHNTYKQVKSVEGEWVLPGEHPCNVPSTVYIVAAQDSARISAVTGNEVLIARYYFDARGILVPLAGNPNLWVVEKYPGHRISLTDKDGNVAVYSRAPVDQ